MSSDPPEMIKVIHRSDDSVKLAVEGDLAHFPWIVQVIRRIMDELEDSEPSEFVIDMSGVSGFEVQSMSLWVGLEHFVRGQGGHIKIVKPSQAVLSVMERDSGEEEG